MADDLGREPIPSVAGASGCPHPSRLLTPICSRKRGKARQVDGAIVTYLQARTYNKALVLLPFVVTGNFHHKSIAYNAEKGDLTPADLAGRRVGVRTYSQTTGV